MLTPSTRWLVMQLALPLLCIALAVAAEDGDPTTAEAATVTTLPPTTPLSVPFATPPPLPPPSSENGTEVPLSAAVRVEITEFDYEHFTRTIARFVGIDELRAIIITYSPSVERDIIIVDFGFVDDARPPNAPSAQQASDYLQLFYTKVPEYDIVQVVEDDTLVIPENRNRFHVPSSEPREHNSTPFIILMVLMALVSISTIAYILWQWFVGRHDKSLHAKFSSAKTWLTLYAMGTVSMGDKHSAIDGSLRHLDSLRHISALACGGTSQMLVVSRGRMYVTGSNAYGELGLGHNLPVSTLTRNKFFTRGTKALRVVCGDAHTLVLTVDGVFSFGCNTDGQLGVGDYDNRDEPVAIEFFQGMTVRGLAAGGNHSLVLCDEGLFSFGAGAEGQLMHGDGETYCEPKLVEYFQGYEATIRHIACGAAHSFVLCNDCELYACGGNGCGQLGLGHNEDVWEPVEVPLPETTSYVFTVSSSYHTLVACDDGVYSCGEGADYKTGVGEEKNLYELTWVAGLDGCNVLLAIAGAEHSIAVTSTLEVYAWGRTTGGKLGDGEATDVLWEPVAVDLSAIPEDMQLAAVMCAPTFTLFLAKEPEDEEEGSDDEEDEDESSDDEDAEDGDGGEEASKKSKKKETGGPQKNPLEKYKK